MSLLACDNHLSEENKNLISFLEEKNIDIADGKHIIIINSTNGCSLCVEKASIFIEENITKKNFTTILTNSSKKLINIRYSEKTRRNKNFIFDSQGFFIRSLIDGSPIIYVLDGHKLENKIKLTKLNAEELLKELSFIIN